MTDVVAKARAIADKAHAQERARREANRAAFPYMAARVAEMSRFSPRTTYARENGRTAGRPVKSEGQWMDADQWLAYVRERDPAHQAKPKGGKA